MIWLKMMDLAWRLKKALGIYPETEEQRAEREAAEAAEPEDVEILNEFGEDPKPLTALGWAREINPVIRLITQPEPGIAMKPEEIAAWDVLTQHCFSREAIRQAGEMEDYLALGISEELEAKWRGEFVNGLLDQYETQPECLDAVLSIAREYESPVLMERVWKLPDKAVTEQSVDDEVLLAGVGSALEVLDGGALASERGASRTRERLLEIADCAGNRLASRDPYGSWRAVLEEIRKHAAR